MHRAKDLFSGIVDFTNLQHAFLAAIAGKRHQPEVATFEYHLETRLWEMHRQLAARVYAWGAYRRFLIQDPKRREIRAAPFRDRVVHHAIVSVLDLIILRGLIADTYACIRGRGNLPAVRRYRAFVRARAGTGYVLQCDIHSYFASVDHAVLLDLLTRRIADRALLALLRSLIEHGAERTGTGMPIGNLTSQMFANLYLDPLDHYVKETLRVRHYIRYMANDFILLLPDRNEARRHLRLIERFLDQRLHLRLNPRRVVISPLGCPRDFLGFVRQRDRRIRIRRRSVRRLWQRLPRLAAELRSDPLSWSSAQASVASWFGLAAHADAFRLSRSIFARRDVGNIGKRLLVRRLDRSRTVGGRAIGGRRPDT